MSRDIDGSIMPPPVVALRSGVIQCLLRGGPHKSKNWLLCGSDGGGATMAGRYPSSAMEPKYSSSFSFCQLAVLPSGGKNRVSAPKRSQFNRNYSTRSPSLADSRREQPGGWVNDEMTKTFSQMAQRAPRTQEGVLVPYAHVPNGLIGCSR